MLLNNVSYICTCSISSLVFSLERISPLRRNRDLSMTCKYSNKIQMFTLSCCIIQKIINYHFFNYFQLQIIYWYSVSFPDLNAQLVNAKNHIARLQKALDISARNLHATNRLINTLHSEALDARPALPPPLPPLSIFNPIPYELVVNSVELHLHYLCQQLSHRILRLDPYCPTRNYFVYVE